MHPHDHVHDHQHDHDHDPPEASLTDPAGAGRRGRRGPRRWQGPPEGPWGPGFGRRFRGGPRGRARKGDVRAAALALLAERPMHGYEMIQQIEERTSGAWRPSPGAVYPALALLEDQGLVRATEDGGKKRFALTDEGAGAAAELGDRKPWDEVTEGLDPAQFRMRDAIKPIALAAHQVMEAGTPAQQEAAIAVLTEARRKLYAILAEDPAGDPSDA
jgi:DNA-binding PadR family transcriptional regulator